MFFNPYKVSVFNDELSSGSSYRVKGQVSSHVGGRDPVEHSSAGQCSKTLGHDVEEGAEQRHLRADQVGKGNSWVDVSPADVADGLDEGGGRQPEAEGHMENVVGPRGPTEGRPQPEEHKEHRTIELGKHSPPEGHGLELPHGERR